MTPRTRIIGDRHRIILAEHPDSAYIASSVDGASVGGFFTDAELFEIITELWAIRRRIRKRSY